MKEFKGTKGEWSIEKKHNYKHDQEIFAINSNFGGEILNEEIITVWTWMIEEEAEANAQLIAAAPDLLEALTHCIDGLKLTSSLLKETKPFIERGEKAINKALGK